MVNEGIYIPFQQKTSGRLRFLEDYPPNLNSRLTRISTEELCHGMSESPPSVNLE